eukprot:8790021-Pyramimonas_sp.AAC.1
MRIPAGDGERGAHLPGPVCVVRNRLRVGGCERELAMDARAGGHTRRTSAARAGLHPGVPRMARAPGIPGRRHPSAQVRGAGATEVRDSSPACGYLPLLSPPGPLTTIAYA